MVITSLQYPDIFYVIEIGILFLRVNVTEKNVCHVGNRTHKP